MEIFNARSWLAILICSLVGAHAQAQTSPHLPDETELVQGVVAKSDIESSKHYCLSGTLTCRSMVALKDKTSGNSNGVYYNVFYSWERQVGSVSYFLPIAASDRFLSMSDRSLDGRLLIDARSPNIGLVKKDQGTISFENLRFEVLGTSKFILAKMVQDEARVLVEGTEFDANDQAYSRPVRIEYFRVNLREEQFNKISEKLNFPF